MDPQTEVRPPEGFARIDSEAEQRYFGEVPLDEIRRELKHYGVNVAEIVASVRVNLAQRLAELAPSQRDTAEARYLVELRSIERIATYIARRNHLSADETEEFKAEVRVRLFENDYAIIRKFQERSSFTTYLATVITHLYHQYRVAQWGHWRPSSEAKRLGDRAITLERMMARDGFSFEEAVSILTVRAQAMCTRSQLEAIYVRLPVRLPRIQLVSEQDSPEPAAVDTADDRIQERDRIRNARSCAAAIDAVIEQMSPDDRLILQLRFWHGMSVAQIGRVLRLDQKQLYKRMDQLLTVLRTSLEKAGIDRAVVGDLLSHAASDLPLVSMPGRMQTVVDVKCPA